MSADELRPPTLDRYIGQPLLKERIEIHVFAALAQGRPLEHILLTGPPGSGKTTFASIVANMMGVAFLSLSMPVNDRVFERAVRSHEGILFLDEVHRLTPRQQEGVMPLLEFGHLVTPTGRTIENDRITVMAATTEAHKIIPPLRQKFPIVPELEPYTDEDMGAIVHGMCLMSGVYLCDATVLILGRSTAGVPRLGRRLVLGARDLWVKLEREPTPAEIFRLTGSHADGLTEQHLRYLRALEMLGGTAGVELIADELDVHPSTCKHLERLLVSREMIGRGPRGRELLSAGGRRIREV